MAQSGHRKENGGGEGSYQEKADKRVNFRCTSLYFSFCRDRIVFTTNSLVFIRHHIYVPLYPFCHSVTPSPAPLVSTNLFSLSMCLFACLLSTYE